MKLENIRRIAEERLIDVTENVSKQVLMRNIQTNMNPVTKEEKGRGK